MPSMFSALHYAGDQFPEFSVTLHPVDELEPIDPNSDAYREASKRLVLVLEAVFHFLQTSRRKDLATLQWAIALGLPSVRGQDLTGLALQLGVTRQDVSKGVTRFLRMSGLPPAFGLKSDQAKEVYRRVQSNRGQARREASRPALS